MLARYAVTWLYLAGFLAAAVTVAALPSHDQSAVWEWASTNVANLRHDPLGSLLASVFITPGIAVGWPALIALAMFGATEVLGNWRTLLVCGAGHVIGTLVSEGVVAYRIAHGLLPASSAYILDIGPSYVVVSAITVAALYGSQLVRVAATLSFAALVFGGHLFSGLTTLQVAPVGHAVAMASSALLGSLLVWRMRSSRRDHPDGLAPALPGVAAPQERRQMG